MNLSSFFPPPKTKDKPNMKKLTLEEAKDKAAQKRGYENFNSAQSVEIIENNYGLGEAIITEAAEIYLQSNILALTEKFDKLNKDRMEIIASSAKTTEQNFELESQVSKLQEEIEYLKKMLETTKAGLTSISNMAIDKGHEGSYYNDTEFDSEAVVYGYNLAVNYAKSDAVEVLAALSTINKDGY